jgi:ribosomal-protein-alanine N-acetyltransferase
MTTPQDDLPIGAEGVLITALTAADVEEIITWRYEPPYDLYSASDEDKEAQRDYLLNPASRCYAVRDAQDAFLGFVSLGADAQVPGGDYTLPALDLGIGIRPTETGQGRGKALLAALLAFARTQRPTPTHFRVTVAGFNERAQRLVHGGGFREVQRFTRPLDGREFRVFVLAEG